MLRQRDESNSIGDSLAASGTKSGYRGSGRSFLHRHTVVLALLFSAVVLAGLVAYEHGETERRIQESRLAVLQELNTVRASLAGAIQRDVSLIRGLVVDIGIEPDLGEQEFDRFVAGLLRQQTFITHIAAAQDFVVTLLYPRAGNAVVMGLDYRTLPEQLEVIRQVLAEGRIRVAGPLDLVQGGRGLIIRAPVHRLDISPSGEIREGPLWGFVSAVIDYDALVRATGITDPTYPLDVAIRGRNSLGGEGMTVRLHFPAALVREDATGHAEPEEMPPAARAARRGAG